MLQDILFFLSVVAMGYLFSDYVIVKKAKRFHNLGYKVSKKYHVHHSVYGLSTFLFIPFTLTNITETILLIGFGLGIILEHTHHEGFIFIEKRIRKT